MSDVITAAIAELHDCLAKVQLAAEALERIGIMGGGSEADQATAAPRAARPRKPTTKQAVKTAKKITRTLDSPTADRVYDHLARSKGGKTMTDVCRALGLSSGAAYGALERLVFAKRVKKTGREYSAVVTAKEDGARAGAGSATP